MSPIATLSVLWNQMGFQCASLGYAHCNLEPTSMFLLSVICYLKPVRAGLCLWGVPSQEILKEGEELGVY